MLNYLIIFIIGYLVAFGGTALPGLLNMTAGKIAFEYSQQASHKFIIGACIVSMLYCLIATQFSFYIQTHPSFVTALYKVGAIIFGSLSVYYLWQILSAKPLTINNTDRNNFFATGLLLSLLNVLPIPFYTGISILIAKYGNFQYYKTEIALLLVSVGLGTGSVLKLYAIYYAKIAFKKQQKTEQKKTITGNHIIAGVTLCLTFMALYKIYF